MKKIKDKKGITLIALVVTIIILLILAGITIVGLQNSGLFQKTKLAEKKTKYSNAKEVIEMELMEIQANCIEEKKEYNIKEIAKAMERENKIIIEKYYFKETAKLKEGIKEITEEISSTLEGIVVQAEEYPEYYFLIGESCKITGVKDGKIKGSTLLKDFENIEEYEKSIYNKKEEIKEEEEEEEIKEEEEEVPEIEEESTGAIDITTYMSVKRNTITTLRVSNLTDATYIINEITGNMSLTENRLTSTKTANSNDTCNITITGTYEGRNYINNLTVYVEPDIVQIEGKEYYEIYTKQDYRRFTQLINTKTGNTRNAKLMNNINFNEGLYDFNKTDGKIEFDVKAEKMTPIGNINDNPYDGIFIGNNKEITGIYINENEKAIGIFGMLSGSGKISYLTIKNSYIEGKKTGGIVGYNEGEIYRCKTENVRMVSSDFWNGGIVAVNNGEIIECAVISTYISGSSVGGIAGTNGSNDSRDGFKHNTTTGIISRCYASGYLENSETSGVVSHNGVYGGEGYIYDCYSRAKILDIYSENRTGGIADVQSYMGRGGYIYNSYYLNSETSNKTTPVHSAYYGSVTNSYSNDISITKEKLNGEREDGPWVEDTNNINDGYPILSWQISN